MKHIKDSFSANDRCVTRVNTAYDGFSEHE